MQNNAIYIFFKSERNQLGDIPWQSPFWGFVLHSTFKTCNRDIFKLPREKDPCLVSSKDLKLFVKA